MEYKLVELKKKKERTSQRGRSFGRLIMPQGLGHLRKSEKMLYLMRGRVNHSRVSKSVVIKAYESALQAVHYAAQTVIDGKASTCQAT